MKRIFSTTSAPAYTHWQSSTVLVHRNLTYIRKYIDENNDQNWSEMLNHISFAMNSSIHADKNRSPFEMMTTRKPITVSNYIEKRYSEDDFEHQDQHPEALVATR